MNSKVLVIAPHNDDEILGVGGTMAKHIDNGDDVYVCVVCGHGAPVYTEKERLENIQESERAHAYLGIKETIRLNFPEVLLGAVPVYQINKSIANAVKKIDPEIVYIPHFGDLHNNHQLVAIGSLVAVRPNHSPRIKRVLAYETLSETEWNAPHSSNVFIPNVFVDITEYIDKKCAAMELFQGQLQEEPNARTVKNIRSLAIHRGSTVSVNAAEAFMLIREINRYEK